MPRCPEKCSIALKKDLGRTKWREKSSSRAVSVLELVWLVNLSREMSGFRSVKKGRRKETSFGTSKEV